jgi:hypothetical protein
MAIDVEKLIATISPEIYCDPSVRDEVKKIVKKEGYTKAIDKAKLIETDFIDPERVSFGRGDEPESSAYGSPLSKPGLKVPYEKHTLVYDLSTNPNQILEEVYFWIIDYLSGAYKKNEKLMDSFVTTPGSSLFTDMLSKRTKVQEEASRIMGNVNTVLRSILNLIYDLKEMKTIIAMYDQYRKGEDNKKEAAFYALKQRWLDQVDIKRAGSSIKQLSITGANQPGFVLLIDAFMVPKSIEEVEKLEVNDSVKRLVKQRLAEFLVWLDESEIALKQRYEVEKQYLKSQVNSLKLYSRWAKPYLKTAKQLEESDIKSSSLVTALNTAIFELCVFAETEYDPKDDVSTGDLPKLFSKVKMRKYSSVLIMNMKFRSTPETVGQHHRFRGRLEITFTCFALNDQEISILKKEIERDDFKEIFGSIEGATTDSLSQIEADIAELTDGNKKEKSEEKKDEDVNPFSSLFSGFTDLFKSNKKDEKKDLSKGIEPDDKYEQVVRSQTILDSRKRCLKLYGTLKKSYNMPAF